MFLKGIQMRSRHTMGDELVAGVGNFGGVQGNE